MPKINTPAMQKLQKQNHSKPVKQTPWSNTLKRIKKDKSAMFGLFIIGILFICAIFPSYIAPYGYDDQDYSAKFIFPNAKHIMGTDNFGRDIFSRIIYGARISIQIGFIAVSLSAIIGGFLGAVAAFYGGKVDNYIMRFIDILLAVPGTLLAISIAAALGPGLFNMMIAVGIGGVPTYSRIVRASILTIKEQEFVEAARAVGASDTRIIFRHMLPNSLAPIIVQATLGVAGAILAAAGLSFIGLGIQPPTPEWGSMLSAGRQYIRDYWYIVTFPGLTIMLTVYAINLFGDGLRDALDPRLKR